MARITCLQVDFNHKLLALLPLQISYAIGVAEPLSIYLDTYGTASKSNNELLDIINKNFDLRPGMIIKYVK